MGSPTERGPSSRIARPMTEKLATRPPLSDKKFLRYMLEYAMIEFQDRQHRPPTRKEILDLFFSKERDDPEAVALEKRLDSLLRLMADEELEAKLSFSPLPRRRRRQR